ncbi:acetylajmalan esterase-like [Silene latifolia]|uniref:acetylajmalan esterase-like n=1 Tax=Silene latifolia TaxID=37657 RepID=UPI003D77F950
MLAFRTLSLLCFILLLPFNEARNEAKIPRIEAIYQFGDSISDTGNLMHEVGPVVCARPPYGQTFFHHPTGRCSDGLLMIDNFAWALKLPFLSPYLDKFGNFSHGANFAVVGATALDVSYLKFRNITAFGTPSSLLVQLGWFKSHLATICLNPSECKQRMGNALFIVGGIGGNDYISGLSAGKTIQQLRSLVPHVVQAISTVIREVIYLGARRIVVPGSFPAGCMPTCLAAFGSNDPAMYDELGCLKIWNDFASFHNFQLQQAIISLQQHYPGVKIIYGDYFSALRLLLLNGGSLGFDRKGLYEPCCIMCGSDGVTACPNPSGRVSWDGLHLTQHAYQFIADQLLKQIMML